MPDNSEVYKCTLRKEDYDYAEKYLGETDEVRNNSIISIQEWLKVNPYLNGKTDAVSILSFLRGCKFNIDKTKWKIKKYYEMRGHVPEWFANRDPTLENLKELLKLGVFLPLLEKDDSNRLVILIRTAAHNPSKHSQNDVFKIGKMVLDLALHMDESVSIYGVAVIFDMENVTFSHALQLPPSIIKKSVDSWKCYPTMTKKLDFVNAPSFVNVILNVFRSLMGQKLRQRVAIHKEGLSKMSAIPQSCINDKEKFIMDLIKHWDDTLSNHREWFIEDEKYKADVQLIK